MRRVKLSIFIVIIFMLTTMLTGCPVDMPEVIQVVVTDDETMRVYKLEGTEPEYGMVFYVGTITPPDRYDNIMKEIAAAGYLVVTPYLIANTAMLDFYAMDRVIEAYPDVQFMLAGHSLGGIAANQYINRKPNNVHGVIYYASRPYELKVELPCLTIIATNDEVIPMNTILNTSGFPEDTTIYIIEGGNHISFPSDFSFPDGPLEITIEDQQHQTARETIAFMNRVFGKE